MNTFEKCWTHAARFLTGDFRAVTSSDALALMVGLPFLYLSDQWTRITAAELRKKLGVP